MKELFFVGLLIFSQYSFAEEEHHEYGQPDEHKSHIQEHEDHDDHGSSKAIGIGKAIEEVSETEGFKLSKESFKLLEIDFQEMTSTRFKIKKSTLVVNREDKGVYRLRNGYFKFLKVKRIELTDSDIFVTIDDFKKGDQIAVSKLDMLKVCDIYSTDTAEYGHAH